MSERRKIQIKSDGTGANTKLLVDGMDLDAKFLRLEIDAEGQAQATIGVYVDEVDVDSEFLTTLEGVSLRK